MYIQGWKFHLGKCLQTFVVNLDSGGQKVWLLVKYCYILSPLLPIKYLAIHYHHHFEAPFCLKEMMKIILILKWRRGYPNPDWKGSLTINLNRVRGQTNIKVDHTPTNWGWLSDSDKTAKMAWQYENTWKQSLSHLRCWYACSQSHLLTVALSQSTNEFSL